VFRGGVPQGAHQIQQIQQVDMQGSGSGQGRRTTHVPHIMIMIIVLNLDSTKTCGEKALLDAQFTTRWAACTACPPLCCSSAVHACSNRQCIADSGFCERCHVCVLRRGAACRLTC
jgi:hypothetical protein